MLSLLELVSQNQPHFQTHQALLVLGLQNDFIQPDGKLPVSSRSGFLDRIHTLIPTFRQQSSNVIWIKTLYEADRLEDPMAGEGDAVGLGALVDGVESSSDDDDDLPKDHVPPTQSRSSKHKQRALDLLKRVSARKRTVPRGEALAAVYEDDADDDEDELFLRHSAKSGPACLPNTPGAEFVEAILPKIERSDTVVRTTNYSAFQGTTLLLILRARLVTELYICGCITNVSVLATVIDAARHGIRINVVGDCLGFRKQSRHDLALKRMVEFFDANILTSSDVVDRDIPNANAGQNSQDVTRTEERLQSLVDKMRLTEANTPRQTVSTENPGPTSESPAITINGQQRRTSDASAAESRTTGETTVTDEQFAERLVQGAQLDLNRDKQPAAKQSLVKSKIRMRSRSDKSKKAEESSKAESSKKGGHKSELILTPATAEKTQDQHPKSPKSATALESSRPKSLTKAGSISKLRESISGTERSLKLSASHPALSSSHSESKDKSTTSRVRLALSRSPRSDSNRALPQPPISPARNATEQQSPASTQTPQMIKMGKTSKLQSLANFPVLRPGDHIAEGDSRIIYDFFPSELHHPTDPSRPLKDLIFTQLYNEVRWQKMMHQQGEVPRLVCCQGEFGADGSMPVYRHPADQTLPLLHYSPKVQVIRKQAEKLVGHALNHVLIQMYRSGNDYISDHSDKTLDIVKGSSIVNVSFGAQRTMRLRTKKSAKAGESEEGAQRETQRVAMPHNSMFVLGLESNEKWLHGIMADKRLPSERSEEETAFSGIRISLTFRHIGTFLDARNNVIWGQGATSKDQRDACDVINDDEEETERIVRAFSRENHSADLDWDDCYGDGFDVLHLHAPPKDLPILFESYNEVEIKMIKMFLIEQKMEYTICEAPAFEKQFEVDRQVGYRDNDANHTEIVFAMPIVLYLDRYHPLDKDDRGRYCTSQSYHLYIQISAMMKFWHNREVPTYMASFLNMLEALEERSAFEPGPFIAGRRFSIGDCGMWPALDELITNWGGWTEERFPKLTEYYKMLWKKKKSVQSFRTELPQIRKSSKGKVVEKADEEEEL
jgi:nicotinamidase-related amidase/alkylated DNA repair dioxygenase AlkB